MTWLRRRWMSLWRLLGSLGILSKLPSPFSQCFKVVKDTNLSLNWEKIANFLWSKRALSSAIVFLRKGIGLTKPKSMYIAKLPHPTTVQELGVFSIMPVFLTAVLHLFRWTAFELPNIDKIDIRSSNLDLLQMGPSIELMGCKSDFAIGADLGQRHDAKARLLRWVLLLKNLTSNYFDTKGARKLAADHCQIRKTRIENVNDPKEIFEVFLLRRNMVTFL
ncbi:hypothetical protein Tco_1111831 [Tanacetum coccineum]|uniref:Uncharacterized protein n=1 Tax=Tanacetum coccineum TaxID=301880 RepID=A0ABQ5IMT8_9ASTR